VKEIDDLKEGMELESVLTNVTKFGAFVDIGVPQDGLVDTSDLADRYVKDPSLVVKVGQIVKVRVLSADANTKRIALSMKTPRLKLGLGGAPKANKRQPAPKPQPSMEDKLAALASRWKSR
jgi:protein Tex